MEHGTEQIQSNMFGSLDYRGDPVTYTYKGTTYWLSSYPYEPCLYLWVEDELRCTLNNAYKPWDLKEAFSKGETVKTVYAKDYDKEFDEEGFCKVLAAALDSGRKQMDMFYAAKLAKGKADEKEV